MLKYSFLSFFILLFSFRTSIAQEVNKSVSITVIGSGKTQEEAKQSAFRSAIEQAFGAFISTKAELLNDQVVADYIASVSSGNIKSFSVLNQTQLPDGSWGVTLKALVSINKLTSFVESKGIAIEINGGLFALNIKQQIINEQAEIQAMYNMVGLLHEQMQTAFDYNIKSGEPKSVDEQNKNWEIPLEVTAKANKNMAFCANYVIKTLSALSLTFDEVKSYKNLNKVVFPVIINFGGLRKTFYLRKQSSLDTLLTLAKNWQFYTSLFLVKTFSDLTKISGDSLWKYESIDLPQGTSFPYGTALNDFLASQIEFKSTIFKFHESTDLNNDLYSRSQNCRDIILNFPNLGHETAKFSWQDKRTLVEIEKMTGFEINPSGIISKFKYGGFIVYENNGHGLVTSIINSGRLNWDKNLDQIKQFNFNGYSDWRIPNIEELNQIYKNLYRYGIGNFNNLKLWSTSLKLDYSYIFDFENGSVDELKDNDEIVMIRAVRSF